MDLIREISDHGSSDDDVLRYAFLKPRVDKETIFLKARYELDIFMQLTTEKGRFLSCSNLPQESGSSYFAERTYDYSDICGEPKFI